ncbi:hypothetical protein ACFLUJ_06805 [Chloroflexota bacterium]
MSQQHHLPCLLLDADVIIFAHVVDIWDFLCSSCTLATGSIVANEESIYYVSSESGKHIDINCASIQAACLIHELKASDIGTVFRELDKILTPDEVRALDVGEAEIISLFYHGILEEELFCTGDGAAIKMMAILGFDNKCISLENVLTTKQHPDPPDIPWEYTDRFVRHHISEGKKLIN